MELFKLHGSLYVDNEKANQSIAKTDSIAEKLGKGFVDVGAKIVKAGAAIGTACVGIGTVAVKSFGDFESSLNKVATIADPSVKSMEDIKKEVLSLSSTMGVAVGDMNEAMYQAISATGDTANALNYVEQATKLAKGGFTDTSTALEAAAKTMNAYGESGEDAFTKIGDIMMQVQNQGITDIGKLSSSLSNVVPIAASLGVSFEQVGASLATMTAQGTETSVATTQLRSAMTELSKTGTKAQIEFEKISGTTFQEFIASGGNVSEAMLLMAESADKQGLTMMDLFGSVEAAQAALSLTGDGASKFATSMDAMNDSAGATQKAYETMSEGINASIGRIVNAGKNMLIELGDKLAPKVQEFAGYIEQNMPKIQETVENVFNAVGNVIGFVADKLDILIPLLAGAVSGFVAFQVISTVVTLYTTLKTTLAGITTAQALLNAVMASNPIGLVATAIGGLIAIGGLLIANWDSVCETFKKVANVLGIESAKVTEVFESIKRAFVAVFNAVKVYIQDFIDTCKAFWEQWGDFILTYIREVFDVFCNIFKGAFDLITDVFNIFAKAFKGDWEGCWNAVKQLFINYKDNFIVIFTSIVDAIMSIFIAFSDAIGIDWASLWEGLKTVCQNTWDNICEWFDKAIMQPINTIIGIGQEMYEAGVDIFNSLWDGIKSVWNGISSWVSEKVDWIADKLMFWRNAESEMSTEPKNNSKGDSRRYLDGTHANGISYIPYDGYIMEAHEGERVLTKEENRDYTNNIVGNDMSETNELLRTLIRKMDKLPAHMRNEKLFI